MPLRRLRSAASKACSPIAHQGQETSETKSSFILALMETSREDWPVIEALYSARTCLGNRMGEQEAEAVRVSRREFIKRVIASGAVASAATYVYGGLSGCAKR